jgi:Uma2 family endonuclease
MPVPGPDAVVSLDEYLDGIELAQEFREHVDGRVRVVPPSSLEHGLLATGLAWHLDPRSRAGSRAHRVLPRGMLIRTGAGDVFSPDGMVYVGAPELERRGGTDFLLNPVLLAEVIPHAGGAYEFGEKWRHYQRIPSLREYLVLNEAEPRVVRYARVGAEEWRVDEFAGPEADIRLISIEIVLKLADVYEHALAADERSA